MKNIFVLLPFSLLLLGSWITAMHKPPAKRRLEETFNALSKQSNTNAIIPAPALALAQGVVKVNNEDLDKYMLNGSLLAVIQAEKKPSQLTFSLNSKEVCLPKSTIETLEKLHPIIDEFQRQPSTKEISDDDYIVHFLKYLFEKYQTQKQELNPLLNELFVHCFKYKTIQEYDTVIINALKNTKASDTASEQEKLTAKFNRWVIRNFVDADLDQNENSRMAIWGGAIKVACSSDLGKEGFRYLLHTGFKWVDYLNNELKLIDYAKSQKTNNNEDKVRKKSIIEKLQRLSQRTARTNATTRGYIYDQTIDFSK